NSGISGYRVNITNTAGYTAVTWAPSPVLTFTGALTEGAGYYARVQAVDGVGNAGDWSGPSTVVTPDLTAPHVVVTAPTQIATGTFPVSWGAEDHLSGPSGAYAVYYREDNGAWQVWIPITTTTSATFVSGTLEHTYYFSVTTTDQAGNRGDGSATTRVAKWRVYIPLVLRNWVWWYQYDPYEPNNTPAQAYGPLYSGQVITAYIWDDTDRDDYYWFTTTVTITVTITLTNIPDNCDFDLYVYYYQDGYRLIAYSNQYGSVSEHVQFTATAGMKYYIRVYPFKGSSDTQPYRLEVKWP
ncbi:MAG: pre-peptidase C-terminal domain-containing protein, partial [Anaerolineae bacterium]